MVDRAGSGAAHDGHDPLAVAAYASIDGSPEAALGARMTEACGACASLAADLRSIAGATALLRSVPMAAPRDFRLSAADARRLSRRGWLARLFGGPGDHGARRLQGLGGAVAALGLAGFAIAAVGPAASIQAAADIFTVTREAPAGGTAYEPAPAIGPVASGESVNLSDDASKAASDPEAGEARTALGVASGAAVVAGVGLVVFGRLRRRPT